MGIFVMLASMFITFALILFQRYVFKKTNSTAINADSAHYLMDLITNLMIICSLVLTKYFSSVWFDTITAVILAAYILYNAYKIAMEAIFVLTDKELMPEIRSKVTDIILQSDGVLGMHDLRTHDLGGSYMFEVHLEIDGQLELKEAHAISENVENKILQAYPEAQIIIHQDPFGIEEKRLDYVLPEHCTKV